MPVTSLPGVPMLPQPTWGQEGDLVTVRVPAIPVPANQLCNTLGAGVPRVYSSSTAPSQRRMLRRRTRMNVGRVPRVPLPVSPAKLREERCLL